MLNPLFAGDTLDPVRVAVAATSLALSVAYLAFINAEPGQARTAVKTAPIAILALFPLACLNGPGAQAGPLLVLSVALALSALGDFFLALKDQTRFFVPGLASFLAAHVAYLIAFLPHASAPGATAIAAMIAVLATAVTLLTIIAPKLGRLRGPVFAYFAVIMAMVAAALFIKEAPWYLGAGAVIFAASDSLIAVRKFLAPFPRINEAVWITYIAAQFMMISGFLTLILP